MEIIHRTIENNTSFAIHGNYFTLDLNKIPLVCSFTNNDQPGGYGGDGSNSSFFAFRGICDGSTNFGSTEFNNLQVTGNANINPTRNTDKNSTVDVEKDRPIYAGGIIFNKTSYNATTYNNFIVHKTFIPFFPDDVNSNDPNYVPNNVDYPVTIKNSKAYDSYSNAIFTWGRTKMDIDNCNLERAGGPLILSQIPNPGKDPDGLLAPNIRVDENVNPGESSKLRNLVTGREFWFTSNEAEEQVGEILALNVAFNIFGKSITLANEKDPNHPWLNLIYAIMPGGGINALTDYTTQGSFSYNGVTLERSYFNVLGTTDPTSIGQMTYKAIAGANLQYHSDGVTFNSTTTFGYLTSTTTASYVNLANPANSFDVNFLDLDPSNLPMDKISQSDFISSKYVALNFNGLGLFLQLF